MKYTIFLIVFMCIITLIIIFLVNTKDDMYEQYDDLYHDFKKSLNHINKKVRKNNFIYYKVSGEILENIIEKLNNKLKNCKNFYINDNLYRGHPDLEFNYSHTMGNKVILSDNDYNTIEKSIYEKDSIPLSSLTTLIHEFAHIHQRFNKKVYQKFYEDYWNYKFVKIHNISKLLKYKRQNPDAEDDNVVWYNMNDNKYYFINCFFDKQNISPYIINTYAYEINKKKDTYSYKNTKPIELDKLTDYNNFFGNIGNNYTPNEIYADYVGMLFNECQSSKYNHNYPAYQLFKKQYYYIVKHNNNL